MSLVLAVRLRVVAVCKYIASPATIELSLPVVGVRELLVILESVIVRIPPSLIEIAPG
jgi:hypothetical protein